MLEELRRLRQCVETAGHQAAGDDEVAGAFGGALAQERGFDFPEAQVAQVVAHHLGDAIAGAERVLHAGAAEIQVAIFQAAFLGHLVMFIGHERGRGADRENVHGLDADFDRAGGELGVDQALAASGDGGADADDPFGAELAALFVNGLATKVGVEDELGQTVPVAQVDEDQSAVVAVGMNPAGQFDFRTHVGRAELAAGVGAITSCDCFHSLPPLR